MKRILFSAAWLGLAGAAQADFKPVVQLDARGRYENQQVSAKAGWGQSADLLLIPAFSFGAHSFLPVMAVLQQGRGVETGADGSPELFFVRRNTFLAKPVYRYEISPDYAVKAWGVAKRAINAEKDDTAWSLGLYDWEEFAGGLGADYRLGMVVDKLSVGLELQHRDYPNWHEQGAELNQGKNYYSKDYDGLKATLSAKSAATAPLPWNASFTFLNKGYTDSYLLKKVSGPNGETTDGTLDLGALRADQLLRLAGDIGLALGTAFSLGVDAAWDLNLSDQNYFDPVFDQGVLDFYGYNSVGGGVSLNWLPRGPEGPSLSVRAGLANRVYSGRPVRDPDGTYRQGKEADLEQDYSLDFGWPVGLGLSVVGGLDWFNALSNQGYAPGTLPAYDLFSTTLGLKYQL